ncbi:MAG: hypothetical protein K1X66_01645 [Verrucomicrobiae bacterium]|nr:hypothetical protein [Verrucomicrobiae bacterium]
MNRRKISVVLMLAVLTFKGFASNIIEVLESKGKLNSKISVLENELKENQGIDLKNLILDVPGKVSKTLRGNVKDENIVQLPNELIEFSPSNLISGYLIFPDKFYIYNLNSGWKKLPPTVTTIDYNKLNFLHVSTDERLNNKENKIWKNPKNEKEIFVEIKENGETSKYIYLMDDDGFVQSIVKKIGEKVVLRQENQFLDDYNFCADIDQNSEKLSKTFQGEASVESYETDAKTTGFFIEEKNNQILIRQVALQSPAYQAGVRAGQVIKKIEGSDVKPGDKKLLSLFGKSGETNKVNISITVQDEEQGIKDISFDLIFMEKLIKDNGKMDVEMIMP